MTAEWEEGSLPASGRGSRKVRGQMVGALGMKRAQEASALPSALADCPRNVELHSLGLERLGFKSCVRQCSPTPGMDWGREDEKGAEPCPRRRR